MACPGPYRCAGCGHCAATAHRTLTRADEDRITRALRAHPPVHGTVQPLRLVQAEQTQTVYTAPATCDESMTCDCPRCQQQRAVIIAHGPKRVAQPWDIKRVA